MTAFPSQSAVLYRNPKRFIAYPMRRTDAGFSIATAPYVQVEKGEAMPLAAAVREALAASAGSVPSPEKEEFTNLASERLQAAGVRTESAFMKAAQYVSIQRHDEFVVITPHRNGGSRGERKGFSAISEKVVKLPATADDAVLGRACIQALSDCV